ncbi:DNA/RNA nuclease SfsA [Candidatus Solincola sp.]|jgi:sugar fermentation stimulation protein A|nr:DNA/RNA nuclease SfsA [Actinomycetota bacterium]
MDVGKWKEGRFLERPNRFLAVVEVEGERAEVHVPDPGRLRELLLPGVRVRLRPASGRGRSTSWDLIGVESPQGWVNIDSWLPNLLFAEAVREKRLEEFKSISRLTPEYRYGESVLDFLLEGGGRPCLVEVKGCTLAVNGVALFPDAPTARGTRHLEELMRATREGYRACAVFVVKHPGARTFAANAETDPVFAAALHRATSSGVEVIPYLAPWRGRDIRLERRLPLAEPESRITPLRRKVPGSAAGG